MTEETSDLSKDRQKKILAHVEYLTTLVEEQSRKSHGWRGFGLPKPKDDIEKEAVRLFVKQIEEVTGKPVIFTKPPGRA
jgi:hypothetical protein